LRSLGVPVATRAGTALRLAWLVSLLFTACDTPPPASDPAAPLRFGFFAADAASPGEDPNSRYRPVVAYFEKVLQRPIEWRVSRDAGRVLADFEAGDLDVVFNRAFAFPHAQQRAGAIPLVTRREDRHVTTVFLAKAQDERQTLQDFRGTRLTFSLRLGSSYVMGRHFLDALDIDPATFFSEVTFTNVADEAISRVQSGQADLGVANSLGLARVLASGALKGDELKIIAETPPHIGQVWFVSKDVPSAERLRVREAFLALQPTDPNHAPILALLASSGFVPALAEDYRELTELMRQMQLLDFDVRHLP
jgi:phosphonate transport system substrate-binding protein